MKRNSFTQIVILQTALTFSVVLVTIVILFLNYTNPIGGSIDEIGAIYFLLASMALTFAAILGGKIIFAKILEKLRAKEILEEKMQGYMKAIVIRFAMMEAAAIFSAVSLLLTGSLYFLIMIAIAFFFFIAERPSRGKIAMELNLTPDERTAI